MNEENWQRCCVCFRVWGGRRQEAILRGWVYFDGQWRCWGCRRSLGDEMMHYYDE